MGHVATFRKDYPKGLQYYQDMLALAQDLNHQPMIAFALHDMGQLNYHKEDYRQAYSYFARAMNFGRFLIQKITLIGCISSAHVFIAPDETDVEYLSLAINCHLLVPMSLKIVEKARIHIEKILPPKIYDDAWERGKLLDIESTFERLLASIPEQEIQPSSPDVSTVSQTANQALTEPLTDRELEILYLVADGYSNKEICEYLILSKNTVRSHLKHLYSKLDVDSRTRAVATARNLGLL
jgi:DNA-binding CsgD family transcriptional regulator